MQTLKNLFHVRDHPSWRKLRHAWYEMVLSDFILTEDFSSVEYKDWNPWSDWCDSWEKFQSSKVQLPKAEKLKATMFSELSTVAKLTRDKLEEGKIKAQENQSLRKANVYLKTKCDELQHQLDSERQIRMKNDYWAKCNLEKEAKLKETLEGENELLTSQVKQTKEELEKTLSRCRDLENRISALQMRMKNDHWAKCNLEREAKLKEILEGENELLTSQVKQTEEELEKTLARCREMENTISALPNQVECKSIKYQINIKNNINVLPSPKWNPSPLHDQLENGEEERFLCLDCINNTANRLGKVKSLDVFDWLCRFEVEYNICNWDGEDLEQILLRCMDSSVFTSLFPLLRRGHTSWLDICIHIAERFIPDLDDILGKEKMMEHEKVLDYFHRMWMIYRITERNGYAHKNDSEYMTAICGGLLPHLYDEVEYIFDEDYDYQSIEHAALSAEYSWLVFKDNKKNWNKKARKAGVGCPSRMNIWKRLEKYPELYNEINNAKYWILLVHLSRVEDLETGEPIKVAKSVKKP